MKLEGELNKLREENKVLRLRIFKLESEISEMKTTIVQTLELGETTIEEETNFEFEPVTETEFDISKHVQIKCPDCGWESFDRSGVCVKCSGKVRI